jgi:hypothetical protein
MGQGLISPPPRVEPVQEFLWWLLTLWIFLAWWSYFSKSYPRNFRLSERILGAFIASVGQIVGSAFVLGFVHSIGWWELGLLNLVISTAVFFFSARRGSGHGIRSEVAQFVRSIVDLGRSSSAFVAVGILAAITAFWYVYLGQLLPPMDTDAWGYHLPWAALAHQERSLGPFAYAKGSINFYPMNGEILFLWWIVGAGTERWANITQAPFAFAAVLASYILAVRVGARRVDAAIAGLLILSVPTVMHQMRVALVDLIFAGEALSAVAFLSKRRLTPASIILAGCASGLVLGTKGSGIYVVIPLGLLLVYRLTPFGMDGLRGLARGRRMVTALKFIGLFVAVTFLFGGYFYVRNWISTGNPTGDMLVKIGGITLFPGNDFAGISFSQVNMGDKLYNALKRGPEWRIVLDGFFDPQPTFFQANRIGGWGGVWTVLMLPSVFLALVWAVIRRRWAVIAIIVTCLLPYFLFTQNHTFAKYHLVILGAGAVSLAYVLSILRITCLRRPLLAAGVALMFLTMMISGPQRQYHLTTAEIANARRGAYQQRDRFIHFDSWNLPQFAQLLRSLQAPGTTLALCGSLPMNIDLAAWNATYTNRVIYSPWPGSGEKWMEDLSRRGADVIYVKWPAAVDWIVSRPDLFEPIGGAADLGAFYRIKKR